MDIFHYIIFELVVRCSEMVLSLIFSACSQNPCLRGRCNLNDDAEDGYECVCGENGEICEQCTGPFCDNNAIVPGQSFSSQPCGLLVFLWCFEDNYSLYFCRDKGLFGSVCFVLFFLTHRNDPHLFSSILCLTGPCFFFILGLCRCERPAFRLCTIILILVIQFFSYSNYPP